jgi:hypothetical protein
MAKPRKTEPAKLPPEQFADRDVPEPEKLLVKKWKQRIDAVEKANEKRYERYLTNRNYYAGTMHTDGKPGLVRTNVIFSTIATLIPRTYARNPDISVTPSEAVDEREYDVYKKFCRTLEVVLQRIFVRGGRLKSRMKIAVRSAMTCEIGWVKMLFQKDIATDPIIQQRMNDIQDNLRRVEALKEKLTDDTQIDEQEVAKKELQIQLQSLEQQVEVVVKEGLVIDPILSEQVLMLDSSVRQFELYDTSFALAEVIWLDEERFETTFGYKPKRATAYYGSPEMKAEEGKGGVYKEGQGKEGVSTTFYKVYEIWHLTDNTIYTWCRGEQGWCRPPYQPQNLGLRWYPYFGLTFGAVDGQFYPICDVDLLKELQDEYNTTRTNFAEHRKENIPVRVVKGGGGLTPQDIDLIKNRKINEIIVVNGTPDVPLSHDIAAFENPAIDPMTYDTTPIRTDIEMVSGAGDAERGTVMRAKTATEAAYLNQGLASRTSERQDVIEDMIGSMAHYAAEVLLQEMTLPQIIKVAGTSAVWPTLSKDRVFDMVQIEIRAGSTGKPNMIQEQETWIKLLPVVKEAMETVTQLRQTGQMDMAEAVTELLRETFRKFDERIDVDSFMPPSGRAGGLQAMAAQVPMLQMKLQQLTEMLQEAQGKLQQAQSGVEAKTIEAQSNAEIASKERMASGIEHERQLAAENARHQREVEAKAAADAAERASRERIAMYEADRKAELEQERLYEEQETKRMEIAAREAAEAEQIASNERIAKIAAGQKQAAAELSAGTEKASAEAAAKPSADIVQIVAELKKAFEEMSKSLAAPRIRKPTYGPDGRIASVQDTLQ